MHAQCGNVYAMETETATRLNCQSCGSRDVTEGHIERCRIITTERDAAVAHGMTYGVPAVATADLWAHFGHVASPQDATRIVQQVLDLGWRPVVGKDSQRLWPVEGSAA